MRIRALVAVFALTLFYNSPIHGGTQEGVNLAWSECGLAGTDNLDFACNSNNEEFLLVGSVVLGSSLPEVVGVEASVVVQGTASTLPDWWSIKPGSGCRASSLSMPLTFTDVSTCVNPWTDSVVGGADFQTPFQSNPGAGNLKAILAVPHPDSARTIPADTEVYVFLLRLNSMQTLGPDACVGCDSSQTLVVNSVRLVRRLGSGLPDVTLTATITGNQVTWQGTPVAVLNRSWGAVKSLYR